MHTGRDGPFHVMKLKTQNDLFHLYQGLCPLELCDKNYLELQQQTKYGYIV